MLNLFVELAAYSKKSTISSREIQTAVRLILPGELAKHAISEGTKSVTKVCNVITFNMIVLFICCHSSPVQVPSKQTSLLFCIILLYTCYFIILWFLLVLSMCLRIVCRSQRNFMLIATTWYDVFEGISQYSVHKIRSSKSKLIIRIRVYYVIIKSATSRSSP